MKRIVILIILVISVSSSLFASIDPEVKELLTLEEIEWLQNHREIRVANEMDWPPFDYNESGVPKGLAIDHIKVIADKLGLELKFIYGFTWSELVDLFQQRKIDVMPVFYHNRERENFTLFTQSYFRGKLGVFTHVDNVKPELVFSRVGMEKSHGSIPIVEQQIPGIKIIEINEKVELVKRLAIRDLDAIIGNPFVFYYISRENQIDSIQLSDYLPLSDEEQRSTSFHIGIRNDWAVLHSILQKVMLNMNEKELDEIKNRWADISIIQKTDWWLIAQIFGIVFLLILFLIWNNRLLKSLVKAKTVELKTLNEKLELKVSSRTKDLINLNNRLELEVEQRTVDYRKAKEEAERANDLKGQILANISHELRTPMHAILSFAEFGMKRQDSLSREKNQHYFTQIQQAGSRLMDLIQDLLDLSQMESGNSALELVPADLKLIIDSVISGEQLAIGEKSLNVIILPFDGTTVVICDHHRIEQVFQKLLQNAIKYSSPGQMLQFAFSESTLELHQQQHPSLQVSLRDQGIGIPENELTTIFDKFRESSKTKSGSGGRGLGLAICAEVVKKHQGKIWAENHPEGGATFHILLPYEQAALR